MVCDIQDKDRILGHMGKVAPCGYTFCVSVQPEVFQQAVALEKFHNHLAYSWLRLVGISMIARRPDENHVFLSHRILKSSFFSLLSFIENYLSLRMVIREHYMKRLIKISDVLALVTAPAMKLASGAEEYWRL